PSQGSWESTVTSGERATHDRLPLRPKNSTLPPNRCLALRTRSSAQLVCWVLLTPAPATVGWRARIAPKQDPPDTGVAILLSPAESATHRAGHTGLRGGLPAPPPRRSASIHGLGRLKAVEGAGPRLLRHREDGLARG